MKIRRGERLVDVTQYFSDHLHALVSLTYFADRYQSVKPSISEDLTIVRKAFRERGIGILEMVLSAAGGVRSIPETPYEGAEQLIMDLCDRLSERDRLLSGGYVYLSDLLGEPNLSRQAGRIIASKYLDRQIDVVVTVATKGVPIAQVASYYLNVLFVIVRRDPKTTEGSTVNVDYVSGSSECIEEMELSKRSLKHGSKVLVVDDFVKGGGTVNGMESMIKKFEAELVGIAVFAESKFNGRRAINDCISLLYVEDVDIQAKAISVVPGSYLTEK